MARQAMPARAARRAAATDVRAEAPWRPVEHRLVALALVVAVVLIGVAWYGAGGTVDWDKQVRWTALAVLGVTVACAGVGIWLGLGMRRVRAEHRAVLLAVKARRDRLRALAPAAGPAAGRVTRVGMTHHHAPDCLLVSGKDVRALSADDLDLVPCGVCA
jgi:sulfite exporter TauE/SafE